MIEYAETSAGLIDALRELGEDYGPLGVALAAAWMTDINVLIYKLRRGQPPDFDGQPAEEG